MYWVVVFVCFCALGAQAAGLDDVANKGVDIFTGQTISGEKVRQCSCNEQRVCVDEMKMQAKQCTVPCFQKFRKITSRPDDLRKCFEEKDDILAGFLNCFEEKVDGCVNTDHGPMINKTDIASIFILGEKKLTHTTDALNQIIQPIKSVIDAAGDFGRCVKECFLNQNRGGFCFDRKGCQPLVIPKKAKSSIRTCSRKMNWKREAGDLCRCSVEAGVTVMRQYCAMFSLMGHRAPRRNHKTRL